VLLGAISDMDSRIVIGREVNTKRKYNNTHKRGGKPRRPGVKQRRNSKMSKTSWTKMTVLIIRQN
jgi:hypothetical protein